nr:hypothetical protein [Micromonospora provocatoris]
MGRLAGQGDGPGQRLAHPRPPPRTRPGGTAAPDTAAGERHRHDRLPASRRAERGRRAHRSRAVTRAHGQGQGAVARAGAAAGAGQRRTARRRAAPGGTDGAAPEPRARVLPAGACGARERRPGARVLVRAAGRVLDRVLRRAAPARLARYGPDEAGHLDTWAGLARSCGWWWPGEEVCVVVDRPQAIRTEPVPGTPHDRIRLRPGGVRYRDGWQPPLGGAGADPGRRAGAGLDWIGNGK